MFPQIIWKYRHNFTLSFHCWSFWLNFIQLVRIGSQFRSPLSDTIRTKEIQHSASFQNCLLQLIDFYWNHNTLIKQRRVVCINSKINNPVLERKFIFTPNNGLMKTDTKKSIMIMWNTVYSIWSNVKVTKLKMLKLFHSE